MTEKARDELRLVVGGFLQAKHDREAARTGSLEERREAEERYRRLSRAEIPGFLEKCNWRGFTLVDGLEVSLDHSIRVNFHRVDRARALEWLDENGHGDVADELRQEHGKASQARKAETKVLKKFVREQLKAGNEVPLDLLGVSVQPMASVAQRPPTRPKFEGPRRRASR